MADQPQLITVEESDGDALDAYVDDILDEKEDAPEVEAKDETDETEDAPEEDNAEEVEPEYVEIKHNGKPVKMTLDEVLEHASKGFDYTTKTQELADQRRQAEAYIQQAHQRLQLQEQTIQDQAKIHAMDSQLANYQQVNWDAWMDQDPVEATKGWQKYTMLKSQRDDVASTVLKKQSHIQQLTAQQMQKQLAEGAAEIQRTIKGWGPELAKSLKSSGMEYGFSGDELDTIVDPRMVKVLHDAYQWRQLQAQKPEVQKRVAAAPKSAKPTGKVDSGDGNRKTLLKQLKSGKTTRQRSDAAASLLDQFIR